MFRKIITSSTLAFLFSVVPAAALTLTEVEYTCPIGGEKFTATVAMSGTSFGMRLDLKQVGPIAQPWPVPKCPSNGFILYNDDFKPEELALLTPIVQSPEYQALQATESNHYLMAYLLARTGIGDLGVAHTLLQASWEVEGEPDRFARYQREMLERFAAYFAGAGAHDEAWWTAQLISANAERQLGMFEASIARIDALPAAEMPDDNLRSLFGQVRKLALERISATRDAEPTGRKD